jgi:hypothetical protein
LGAENCGEPIGPTFGVWGVDNSPSMPETTKPPSLRPTKPTTSRWSCIPTTTRGLARN